MSDSQRFKFIGHALRGDGPFRPSITYDGYGNPITGGESYINRYPRESLEKYARRIEVAFYASPVARVTSKFTGYIAAKPVSRDINGDLFKAVAEDVDGKGNDMDIFWQNFMLGAKARGTMLLLVDMPEAMPDNMETQLNDRKVPYWTTIAPELVTDFQLGDDGKFNYVAFSGTYQDKDGKNQKCTWYFDREIWQCREDEKVISQGEHPLMECPVAIFAEDGDYPCFGPFAPISDLSKRLYNLESELDEILRSQTFSLLTLQVGEDVSQDDRLEAAQQVGETVGTSNLMMHTGNTPAFIAPPDGPARTYMERIAAMNLAIAEIGLDIATINQQESGIAMQRRFESINVELSKFSEKMESMERRAWDLTGKWLGIDERPDVNWARDFNIADPQAELDILSDMNANAMPPEVIIAQQKRVVAVQFDGMETDAEQELINSIENGLSDITFTADGETE